MAASSRQPRRSPRSRASGQVVVQVLAPALALVLLGLPSPARCSYPSIRNSAPVRVFHRLGAMPSQAQDSEQEGEGQGQGAPGSDGPATSAKSADQMYSWPAATAGPVTYHGGRLLTQPITVHLIFYGNWPAESGQAVVQGFVTSLSDPAADSLGPSVRNWWGIVTKYTDSSGQSVSPKVILGSTVTVGGDYSTQLSDGFDGSNNDIGGIVAEQIANKSLPLDSNAFYAVITSADVHIGSWYSGFCGLSGYCGWHTQTVISGTAIQYSLVGDGSQQCASGCSHSNGLSATPNGFFGVDGLIGTLAHELAETATNPDTQTGYWAQDQNGQTAWENADLCNTQYTDSTHPDVLYDLQQNYAYNLYGVGGLKFLVQTNVDLSKQECVLQGSLAGDVSPAPPSDISPPPPSLSGDPSPPPPAPTEEFSPPPPTITQEFSPTPPAPTNDPSPPPPYEGDFSPAPPLFSQDSSPPPPMTTVDWSPPPPAPPQDGGQSICAGIDLAPCSACTSTDGCNCLQGSCLSLCQVSAALGASNTPCSSCGSSFCYCGTDGTCQAPSSFFQGIWNFFKNLLF